MSGALMGKRVVNTRALPQAQALDDLLCAHGALPISYPCLRIVPPDDRLPLDAALRDLAAGHFDWLVLTSANTVLILRERLDALGLRLTAVAWHTAAIGPATADAAHKLLGLTGVIVPEVYVAEALADHLPLAAGVRVLVPASALAEPTLAERLTARGATVCVVEAYQTVRGDGGVDLRELLQRRNIDAITFTSASTVTYLLERLQAEGGSMDAVLDVVAACIGPRTAATARAAGFRQVIVPGEHSLTGLLYALAAHFSQEKQDN